MNNSKQLYQQDYNLWLEKMAIAIKEKSFDAMDWNNLLEEIEDMGASQKRALRSFTKRLIEHILKLKYWQGEVERNKRHWEAEVVNFREEIKQILQDSPSLKNYLRENYSQWYKSSLKSKKREFTIPTDDVIELNLVLDDDYFG